jgi:hypothetical protein
VLHVDDEAPIGMALRVAHLAPVSRRPQTHITATMHVASTPLHLQAASCIIAPQEYNMGVTGPQARPPPPSWSG